MDIKKLRTVLSNDRFEWRKHVLKRQAERGISQENILRVVSNGELIEDYPDDRPYPSALFLGFIAGMVLHVVISLDENNDWAYIITAYQPSLEVFKPDYKTRR